MVFCSFHGKQVWSSVQSLRVTWVTYIQCHQEIRLMNQDNAISIFVYEENAVITQNRNMNCIKNPQKASQVNPGLTNGLYLTSQ